MDTLAQELIDEIINNVPPQDMPSSSLVAKRWRRKSQQRNFERVLFMFENLDLWEFNIPQDLVDGIPSYVRHVRFKFTYFSNHEPGTLSRVLKSFGSMISLAIDNTSLPPPEELAVPLSLGEFGNITRLELVYVVDTVSVITSLIFSFPNLRELITYHLDLWPDEPFPTTPDASQRGLLELPSIHSTERDNYPAFAQLGLASRRLSLDPSCHGIELFIKRSSETMVALTLIGMQPLRVFGKQNL